MLAKERDRNQFYQRELARYENQAQAEGRNSDDQRLVSHEVRRPEQLAPPDRVSSEIEDLQVKIK